MSCTTLVRLGSSEKRVPAYVSGCIYQSVGGLHNNYLNEAATDSAVESFNYLVRGEWEEEEGGRRRRRT